MDLKLNDSELIYLLSIFDDTLGYDPDGLERECLLSILRKIGDNVQYKHHQAIDKYVVDIRKAYGVE